MSFLPQISGQKLKTCNQSSHKCTPGSVRSPLTFAILLAIATTSVTNRAFAAGAPAATDGKATLSDDPMLRAMQQELDREKSQLVLTDMQRPYFIEYHFDDMDTFEAVANYGALTMEQASHQRLVRVIVRIGNYTTDSSTARGDGSVALAPQRQQPPRPPLRISGSPLTRLTRTALRT